MEGSAAATPRERGFLLIADMEGSTESKYRLGELGALAAMRTHNRLVRECCQKATPAAGTILSSLGDAIVAKFPAGDDDASSRRALASCLEAARQIVAGFEALPPLAGDQQASFPLRTKLTLQCYDAFRYCGAEDPEGPAEELVGPDIDAAFRVQPVSWRLQVLATERFASELLRHSEPGEASAGGEGDARLPLPRDLLAAAHAAREATAEEPRPAAPLALPRSFSGESWRIDYWITDAREVSRLKGIRETQRLFLLSFEPPASLVARGQRSRLTIKVRQNQHAVVLAGVSLEEGHNDDFIDAVLQTLGDPREEGRLESELTLFAAAKLYGEFDFFFRVSCIDDESLRRFFEAIRHEHFGVHSVEVRSTVADRFYVSPHYARILQHFRERPRELVLTWFRREPESDLFLRFVYYMEEGPGESVRPVEILEAGEVIHHKPVYALFLCQSLTAYADFFATTHLNPTGCRSHIGQASRPGEARLRYGLMNGVWVPSRRRVLRRET